MCSSKDRNKDRIHIWMNKYVLKSLISELQVETELFPPSDQAFDVYHNIFSLSGASSKLKAAFCLFQFL